MKNRMRFRSLFAAALIVAFGELIVVGAAMAKGVSETAKAGAYSVDLKVLPAEKFVGPNAEMVEDAGAAPVTVNGPEHPNHHLVAFIKKNGAPVEDASVSISYRRLSPNRSDWTKLPVAQMHVTDKTLATTHYGNNVKLKPGNYEARVTVNGTNTATIRFTLPG